MRSFRHVALLLLSTALLAGCGGAETSAPSTQSAPPAAPKSGTARATDGTLTVQGTSQHIGSATTGTAQGVLVLPDRPVAPDDQYREGVGAGASCENTDVIPSDENMDQVIEATLCLLNGERADHGLGALRQDDQLASAAKQHSQEMIRDQYFDHVAPNGSTPVDRIRRTGYIPQIGSWIVGENLAWGTGSLASPKGIVKAWMNSEGHRENILRSSFDQIGFGVYVGNPSSKDGEGATYTTTFGGKSGDGSAGATPKAAKKAKKKAKKARAAKFKTARISLGQR